MPDFLNNFLNKYGAMHSSLDAGISPVGYWLCNLILVAFLITCAYTDATKAKIYNKYTFPAMGFGLAIHTAFGGFEGFKWSLLGWTLGMAIQWIPFMLGLAKAGDVKLLAAVGALKGWSFCLFGFLYGAAAFGLLSLPWLFRRGELRGVGRNIKGYFQFALVTFRAPDAPAPTVTKKFVPWGVGLSVGFLLALLIEIFLGKAFWF